MAETGLGMLTGALLRHRPQHPAAQGFGLRGILVALLLATLVATMGARSVDARGGAIEVDVELVLAVDVSYSMDMEEQRLQREGYILALTSPEVLQAISKGVVGRIAVTYMEWAGWRAQRVVVPWTLIDGPESAQAFVAQLEKTPIIRWRRTSISGAIHHAMELFENNGFDGMRRVIDISGDGPNNEGASVLEARDMALAAGVTINGLPIMTDVPGVSWFAVPDLDLYFRDCVIGGPGAFLVPIRSREEFVPAIRMKILREIAGLPGPVIAGVPLWRAQMLAEGPRADCLLGERQWQQRFQQ